MHRWEIGSIAYAHIFGEPTSRPGKTMKCYSGFNFQNQEYIESPKEKSIVTYLNHKDGYVLKHTLTHSDKSSTFTVDTEFTNNSESDVEIDML